jgi:hypothetical protein
MTYLPSWKESGEAAAEVEIEIHEDALRRISTAYLGYGRRTTAGMGV